MGSAFHQFDVTANSIDPLKQQVVGFRFGPLLLKPFDLLAYFRQFPVGYFPVYGQYVGLQVVKVGVGFAILERFGRLLLFSSRFGHRFFWFFCGFRSRADLLFESLKFFDVVEQDFFLLFLGNLLVQNNLFQIVEKGNQHLHRIVMGV